jgi:hypothetical protein
MWDQVVSIDDHRVAGPALGIRADVDRTGGRLAAPAGGSGTGSVRRIAAVVAMLTGALAGARLLKIELWTPLLAAVALALATWLIYVPAASPLGKSG